MELLNKHVMMLRSKTNLPMMQCKKALEATKDMASTEDEWFSVAIDHIRKNGGGMVQRLSERAIENGCIGMAINESKCKGTAVLIGCQTDFVASNEVFVNFANQLAQVAVNKEILSDNDLGRWLLDYAKDMITEKIQLLGENIKIEKIESIHGICVAGYNHAGKIVAFTSGEGNQELLRKVAMHVAAVTPIPLAVNRESVDASSIKKEEEILMNSIDVQSKPEAIRQKIVQGKLNKFFKENTLLEQEMVVGAEKNETVDQFCKRNNIKVLGYSKLSIKG